MIFFSNEVIIYYGQFYFIKSVFAYLGLSAVNYIFLSIKEEPNILLGFLELEFIMVISTLEPNIGSVWSYGQN